MGESPLDAAIMARVPLQLQTAIALQTPASGEVGEHDVTDVGESSAVDNTMMPVYGQFIYLAATALVTANVLGFISVFVMPTMETMFREFYSSEMPYQWVFSTAPALWILCGVRLLLS